MRANHIVEIHQQKREQANKYQKTDISDRVVNIIHESHGRILKWEDHVWSEVDHDEAREKISQFFVQLRRKKSRRTKPSPRPNDSGA
jgi:DNA replicative helicase MCM subunit Mcm2 (Cdc46/Mcm family)